MRKGKTRILTAVFTIALMMFPVIASAGSLEPSATPAPTMKTLDEIYNRLDESYTRMLDIANRLGVNTRFEVVLNGLGVLDHNTGLVWEQYTDPTTRTWDQANTYCSDLIFGNKDDWRFPTKGELISLVDIKQVNPALPLGHPFIDVNDLFYWSSTTHAYDPDYAWAVGFSNGNVYSLAKYGSFYVRCVRSGQ